MRIVQQVSITTGGDGEKRLFVRVLGESEEALTDLYERIVAWSQEFDFEDEDE